MALLSLSHRGVADAYVDEAMFAVKDIAASLWAAAEQRQHGEALSTFQLLSLEVVAEALANDADMLQPEMSNAAIGPPTMLGLGENSLANLFMKASIQLGGEASMESFLGELARWRQIIEEIRASEPDQKKINEAVPLLRRVCTLAGQLPSGVRRTW